jgi:hypothetical protein
MKSLPLLIFISLIILIGGQPVCNQWKDTISTDSMQLIVDYHNQKRNKFATEVVYGDDNNISSGKFLYASNMLQMYWSHELAKEAQKWADKCQFEHSNLLTRKIINVPAGENLAFEERISYYPGMSWKRAIDLWFDQKNLFLSSGGSVDHFEKNNVEKTGAFTQLIWANTFLVGCGFAQIRKENKFSNLYVCRYGPTGNIVKLPVYMSYPSITSNCPHGTTAGNKKYKGLCCLTINGYCDKYVYTEKDLIEGTVPDAIKNYFKSDNKLK